MKNGKGRWVWQKRKKWKLGLVNIVIQQELVGENQVRLVVISEKKSQDKIDHCMYGYSVKKIVIGNE